MSKYSMLRKSDNFLLPIKVSKTKTGKYNLYPAFHVDGKIYDNLNKLSDSIIANKIAIIDGYEGLYWDKIINSLYEIIRAKGYSVNLVDSKSAMKSQEDIDFLILPYMGENDSIFGRMTDLKLIDYFDRTKLYALKPCLDCDINIIYGTGAALSQWKGLLVYVDLPKNELQFRMAAGKVFNLGTEAQLDEREYYKRCYFIDWPILDNYKGSLISRLEWVIDEQRIDKYTYIDGETFRSAMENMCKNSFRVRPWFVPGVWGGYYLRDNITGLNKRNPNIAWSYELMALENGIILEHDEVLMEVSFNFLMSYGYKKILGHCAEDFKEDFPIRYDFLDTIGGGNLSIQCHPQPEYIRSRFGKKYTQDETYYILKNEKGSAVYLGFQKGVQKAEFKKVLENSQKYAEKIEINKYVQSFHSKKHDLFLIPNGTIHASGAGNLVLEISSAPYIFTFKMYDWVRLDIDGRPRPINIKHGLNNVRFERNGDIIKETLICKPYIMEENKAFKQEHLPTHSEHFYDIHRYTIHNGCNVTIDTENKCHVWMIVEGSDIEVTVKAGRKEHYNYIETFIIPADAKSYTLTNTSGKDVILVKTFVKDNYIL